MTVPQLAERMTGWLKAEYQACLFELESKAIGYALYRFEPEYIYLRQLFVQPEMRRRSIQRTFVPSGWSRCTAASADG